MITTLRKLPYEQRLKECNLTKLEERRKRGDLLETHNIMHGLEQIPEVTFFARGDMVYSAKGAHFEDLQGKIEAGAKQEFLFTTCIVIPWNALPVCSKSTLQFKIEYDKFWGV